MYFWTNSGCLIWIPFLRRRRRKPPNGKTPMDTWMAWPPTGCWWCTRMGSPKTLSRVCGGRSRSAETCTHWGKHDPDPAGANWSAAAFFIQSSSLFKGLVKCLVAVRTSAGRGRDQCTPWRFAGGPLWRHPAVADRWGSDACPDSAPPWSSPPGTECVTTPVPCRAQHPGFPQPATQPQVKIPAYELFLDLYQSMWTIYWLLAAKIPQKTAMMRWKMHNGCCRQVSWSTRGCSVDIRSPVLTFLFWCQSWRASALGIPHLRPRSWTPRLGPKIRGGGGSGRDQRLRDTSGMSPVQERGPLRAPVAGLWACGLHGRRSPHARFCTLRPRLLREDSQVLGRDPAPSRDARVQAHLPLLLHGARLTRLGEAHLPGPDRLADTPQKPQPQ